MSGWVFLTAAVFVSLCVLRFSASGSGELRQYMADHGVSDPVINLFAWYERAVSFRRRA